MNCLVKINLNNRISYESANGEWVPVTFLDAVITPNGADDPKLVCLIYAQKDNGNMVCATSDKFKALEDQEYSEFFPTPHMIKLNSGQR